MAFSTSFRNQLINATFGNTEMLQPANWYVGLSTTSLNETGGNITEPNSLTGYARTVVANNTSNWTTAVDGTVKNSGTINMNEVNSDVGKIASVFLADTENGNAIAWTNIAIAEQRELQAFTTVFFVPNSLTFSWENE